MSRPPDPLGRKPLDDEIDVYGLTHQGLVRSENQDHFLVCQLRKQMDVVLTSLPEIRETHGGAERLAFLAMVADGVGRGRGGEASRRVVSAVSRYVSESIDAYYTADSTDHEAFTAALHAAAGRVHGDLVQAAEANPAAGPMATTLTLWIGVWPSIYLVQVGDSRYYVLCDGELRQISRDQTVGQELVDSGVLADDQAVASRWANALSSTIGGSQSAPVVTRLDADWGLVHMLCSDGLTKHVSDERIRERLSTMTSAKQACEALVQDALDDGGSDNVTVIVGRAVRKRD